MKTPNPDTVKVLDSTSKPEEFLEEVISSGQEDPFFVMNMDDVLQKYETWKEQMPNVKPFYAVKCNDSTLLLQLLAGLGTGFDVASKAELEKVLSLGVEPDRIIFANPVKMASHLKYAAAAGVDLMTFDNAVELRKIHAHHPKARLVLRLRIDSIDPQCPLGMKFGIEPKEAEPLLRLAAGLGLSVVGVSFHVGSGCHEFEAFGRAISAASEVFAVGTSLGHQMYVLDIGGGFPGETGSSIGKASEIIHEALTREFGNSPQLEVIAEPGRFFVSSAYVLATSVHGIREKEIPMYYINDGVYGSFNCMLYDHAVCIPKPLKVADGPLIKSQVWGPTCDSLDLVSDGVLLPRLSVGDWLLFKDMGAYTIPSSSPFNGFPLPLVHYVISESAWSQVKDFLEEGLCQGLERFPTPSKIEKKLDEAVIDKFYSPYVIEILPLSSPSLG